MTLPVVYRPTPIVHAPTATAGRHGCVCGDPHCHASAPQTIIGVVVENTDGTRTMHQPYGGPILAPTYARGATPSGWEQVGRYLMNFAMIVGLILGVALLVLSARQATTAFSDPSVPREIPEHVAQIGSTSV